MIASKVTAFVKQDSGMIAGSKGDSPEGAEHDVEDDDRGGTMNSPGESSFSSSPELLPSSGIADGIGTTGNRLMITH